jgi:hypothetical protein
MVLLHGHAQADEMTGKELYAYCSKDRGAENLMCAAYIAGFVDGVVMGQPLSLDMTQGQVCLPRVIDARQARIATQKFMQESPDILHEPARLVLSAALWRAFPCGR